MTFHLLSKLILWTQKKSTPPNILGRCGRDKKDSLLPKSVLNDSLPLILHAPTPASGGSGEGKTGPDEYCLCKESLWANCHSRGQEFSFYPAHCCPLGFVQFITNRLQSFWNNWLPSPAAVGKREMVNDYRPKIIYKRTLLITVDFFSPH